MNKPRIIFFSFVVLLLCTFTASAQSATRAARGTYQIQADEKSQEAITTDALEQIEIQVEAARLESQDTYIRLSPTMQVYVPSRQRISSSSFIPYPEDIVRVAGIYGNTQ